MELGLKRKKFLALLTIGAVLNAFDFASDIAVILKFRCVGEDNVVEWDSVKVTTEHGHVASGCLYTSDGPCVKHSGWFAIALVILLLANTLQALVYMSDFLGKEKIPLVAMRFVVAWFQLSGFCEVIKAFSTPTMEDKPMRLVHQDLLSKIGETIPQAYFQTYVMFYAGLYYNPLNVASVGFSLLSLSWGLTDAMKHAKKEEGGSHLTEKVLGRIITALFFASHVACRCMVIAVFFSPYGKMAGVVSRICFVFISFFFNGPGFALALKSNKPGIGDMIRASFVTILNFIVPIFSLLEEGTGIASDCRKGVRVGFFRVSFPIAENLALFFFASVFANTCEEKLLVTSWEFGVFMATWFVSVVFLFLMGFAIKTNGHLKFKQPRCLDKIVGCVGLLCSRHTHKESEESLRESADSPSAPKELENQPSTVGQKLDEKSGDSKALETLDSWPQASKGLEDHEENLLEQRSSQQPKKKKTSKKAAKKKASQGTSSVGVGADGGADNEQNGSQAANAV